MTHWIRTHRTRHRLLLATRSDDAVGAGFGLRQGAAGLQLLNIS